MDYWLYSATVEVVAMIRSMIDEFARSQCGQPYKMQLTKQIRTRGTCADYSLHPHKYVEDRVDLAGVEEWSLVVVVYSHGPVRDKQQPQVQKSRVSPVAEVSFLDA